MKRIVLLIALLLPVLAYSQETFVNTEVTKKNALFEELTGASCGYCPRAHATEARLLEAFPGRICAVNIHAGGFATPYHSDDPRLNVDEGEELDDIFNVDGYPSAVIARHQFGGKKWSADENKWATYIQDSILPQDALVNIAAKAQVDWETRKLTLTVQMYYTGQPAESEQYLHVAMTQSHILAGQSDYGEFNPTQFFADGNYDHLHVFRGYINENSLDGIKIDVEQGKVIEKVIEYDIPEAIKEVPVTLADLNFVAFITADKFAEVQNACDAEVEYINMPEGFQILWMCQTKAYTKLSCDPVAGAEFSVKNEMGADVEKITYKVITDAGEETFTKEFSPAIKEGATGTVLISSIALSAPNTTENVKIKITGVNDVDYTYEHGSEVTIPLSHTSVTIPSDLVILNILQDQYGEEITWKVGEIGGGQTLYTGGPYENLEGKGTLDHYHELKFDQGCYYFTINDKGGNGINGKYGKGAVVLKDWQGAELYKNKGKYGEGFSIALDARTAAVEKLSANAFKLYPNPASEEVVIEAEAGNYTVSVYGISGVMVRAPKAFSGRYVMNVSGLAKGLYVVKLRSESGKVGYQKLIVK